MQFDTSHGRKDLVRAMRLEKISLNGESEMEASDSSYFESEDPAGAYQEKEVVLINFPPDLLSVSTCDCDSSNVSPLSSEASEESGPRSIFKSYWRMTGSQRQPNADVCRSNAKLPERDPGDSACHGELKKREAESGLYDPSIWAPDDTTNADTAPCGFFLSRFLHRPMIGYAMNPPLSESRKAKSDSLLQYKKLPSCLRGSASANKLDRSTRSVTFHQNVHVLRYEVPQERWAEEGWSQWFH